MDTYKFDLQDLINKKRIREEEHLEMIRWLGCWIDRVINNATQQNIDKDRNKEDS